MVFSRKTAYAWSLSVITLAISAAASDVSGLLTKLSSRNSSSLEHSLTTNTDGVLSGKPLQLKSGCDCGPHGYCTYDYAWREVCECNIGFENKNGYCVECDCGFMGKCEFNEEGEKICKCREGYGDRNGECAYCSCYLDYMAISCNFTNGIQKCICPEGYQLNFNTCEEIDECRNRSACPEKTTCLNTKGNYTCSCDSGYRPLGDKLDPKFYGCTDIDECWEQNACPYRDTSSCVNLEGSYDCYCNLGYYHRLSETPIQFVGCEKDRRAWRTGYIVLIVLFIIAITGLYIAIIRKRSSS